MKLINRYVNEIGKNLPLLKGREDIEKELRSTLEDMLEERSQKTGRPADEALELELLREYGDPFDVAMTYNPQPYLIGPRLFPTFLRVLKIVITSIATVLLIVTGIRAGVSGEAFMSAEFVKILGDGLENTLIAVILGVGNIVTIFAILERAFPHATVEELEDGKMWEPESLTKEPQQNAANRGELIFEIVFILLGLAVLNGIFNIPIFREGFAKFVPWINAVFLAEVVLNIFLLRKALWSRVTRFIKVVIEIVGIIVTYLIIQTPNVIGFPAEAFINSPENTVIDFDAFMGIFNLSVSISLYIVIIIQGIELVKTVINFIKSMKAEQ